ncbi:hypothetical protein [Butyrivibrio sp. XPD2002]|uniref:hypothetical protein n=1 Tax=Butyrivibrio sp. XPD2002 TaxID=1280665 RepID=UPI0004203A3A|nr:hypothetical protein [Butyrivibrio sp. XPD2002]
MGTVEYEKVEGFDVPGALQGEKVELPSDLEGDSSDLVTEHIYIIFSKNISIENGIKLIEDEVLSGEKLDVRRQDESGHAIVCVVNSAQRKAIENLADVERVKVQEAANPTSEKKTDEGEDAKAVEATEAGRSEANSTEAESAEAESTEAEGATEKASDEASTEEVTDQAEASNTAESAETSEESETSEEAETSEESEESEESETEASVAVTSDETGGKNSGSHAYGITIAAVIALVAVAIAVFLRKK